MQANTIINSALRKLLVVPSGATATVNQYADGLEGLNDIIKLWSANTSLIYQDTREEIVLVSGTQEFTLGTTGDYVTIKPMQVLNASLKIDNYEYPLDIIDANVYERVQDKTRSSRPCTLYFRDTHPNSTFYFDAPLSDAYTLILTSMKELTTFPDGTTEVSLPDYYESALKHNLTTYLAPEYGAANRVTPLMVKMADDSYNAIIGRANKTRVSTTDVPWTSNSFFTAIQTGTVR